MKSFFFLFILTFSLSDVAICLGQKAVRVDTSASAPRNFMKAAKGIYTSSECGYAVTFPEEANNYSTSSKTSDGTLHYHFMSAGSPLLSYNISCIEYPRQIEADAMEGRFFDDLLDKELAQSGYPAILERGEMTLEGHPARFFTAKMSSQRLARYRVVVAANKIYYVSVIAPERKIKGMKVLWLGEQVRTERGYDAVALRFLDSFHLISPLTH